MGDQTLLSLFGLPLFRLVLLYSGTQSMSPNATRSRGGQTIQSSDLQTHFIVVQGGLQFAAGCLPNGRLTASPGLKYQSHPRKQQVMIDCQAS